MNVLVVIDGLMFLFYGIMCVSSHSLVGEFERYGISNLRVSIGGLEILAGIGLIVGLKWMPALAVSSGGLALLMLIAFGFRIAFKDSVPSSIPSIALALLNAWIFMWCVRRLPFAGA